MNDLFLLALTWITGAVTALLLAPVLARRPTLRIFLIAKPGAEPCASTREPAEDRVARLRADGYDVFDCVVELPERYRAASGTVGVRR